MSLFVSHPVYGIFHSSSNLPGQRGVCVGRWRILSEGGPAAYLRLTGMSQCKNCSCTDLRHRPEPAFTDHRSPCRCLLCDSVCVLVGPLSLSLSFPQFSSSQPQANLCWLLGERTRNNHMVKSPLPVHESMFTPSEGPGDPCQQHLDPWEEPILRPTVDTLGSLHRASLEDILALESFRDDDIRKHFNSSSFSHNSSLWLKGQYPEATPVFYSTLPEQLIDTGWTCEFELQSRPS